MKRRTVYYVSSISALCIYAICMWKSSLPIFLLYIPILFHASLGHSSFSAQGTSPCQKKRNICSYFSRVSWPAKKGGKMPWKFCAKGIIVIFPATRVVFTRQFECESGDMKGGRSWNRRTFNSWTPGELASWIFYACFHSNQWLNILVFCIYMVTFVDATL